jgi:dihydrofolate reductase
MRKVIAAINMTIDGVCDHRVGVVDEKLHQHYARLIDDSGVILYGRSTFELMKYWQTLLTDPSDQASMNEFAHSIDKIEKLVFSSTLNDTGWNTATIARQSLEETISALKSQPGKDILIGSRSLIIQLLNSGLVDEFQICIHPMVEGKGLRLFDEIEREIFFKLTKTKSLPSGVTILYYQPT